MSARGPGVSRYAAKRRDVERSRGYSRRPTSPFYLSPIAIKLVRLQRHVSQEGEAAS